MKLILASASPRRKELIRHIEDLRVEICPSDIEETADRGDPEKYAVENAHAKAQNVFDRKGGLVLGADTVVVLDGEILEKPHNIAEADDMFKKLCGKTHKVVTGLCIIDETRTITDSEVTYVTFGEYNGPLIQTYIMSGAPFDKAGGYGIQDLSIRPLIVSVDGDFDNVIGLPVKKVEQLLKQFRS